LRIEYLPPYSPDLNPIEYSFSVIKKEMKNRKAVQDNEDLTQFADEVLKIAKEKVTSEIAISQFRHCNIQV
jgi:transposase